MPRWRGDGREIYYLDAKGSIVAVELKPSAGIEVGERKTLFQTNIAMTTEAFDFLYDVSHDGRRFITVESPESSVSTIHVVVNGLGRIVAP